MINDTFVMSVRQAAELDYALARNGWTPEEVKKLSTGNLLSDVREVLRGFAEIAFWRESDMIINFSVTSNGMTGSEWISRLRKPPSQYVGWGRIEETILNMEPTSGITFKIDVIKGGFFPAEQRSLGNVFAEASRRGWQKPRHEIACLVFEKFSDEDIEKMGLERICIMHDPLLYPDSGTESVLSVHRSVVAPQGGKTGRWLSSFDLESPLMRCKKEDRPVQREDGFAFIIP